jgi:hypothetical protein
MDLDEQTTTNFIPRGRSCLSNHSISLTCSSTTHLLHPSYWHSGSWNFQKSYICASLTLTRAMLSYITCQRPHWLYQCGTLSWSQNPSCIPSILFASYSGLFDQTNTWNSYDCRISQCVLHTSDVSISSMRKLWVLSFLDACTMTLSSCISTHPITLADTSHNTTKFRVGSEIVNTGAWVNYNLFKKYTRDNNFNKKKNI